MLEIVHESCSEIQSLNRTLIFYISQVKRVSDPSKNIVEVCNYPIEVLFPQGILVVCKAMSSKVSIDTK